MKDKTFPAPPPPISFQSVSPARGGAFINFFMLGWKINAAWWILWRFIKPGGPRSDAGSAKYWNWMTWVNAQNTQEHMRAHTAGGDRAAVQTPVMVFFCQRRTPTLSQWCSLITTKLTTQHRDTLHLYKNVFHAIFTSTNRSGGRQRHDPKGN